MHQHTRWNCSFAGEMMMTLISGIDFCYFEGKESVARIENWTHPVGRRNGSEAKEKWWVEPLGGGRGKELKKQKIKLSPKKGSHFILHFRGIVRLLTSMCMRVWCVHVCLCELFIFWSLAESSIYVREWKVSVLSIKRMFASVNQHTTYRKYVSSFCALILCNSITIKMVHE